MRILVRLPLAGRGDRTRQLWIADETNGNFPHLFPPEKSSCVVILSSKYTGALTSGNLVRLYQRWLFFF